MKKLFIFGIAALLLVAFTVPAMAEVKIGGIIFTDLYYLDRDADNSRFHGTGYDDYQVTTIQVPNITRLYARWTNEDNVGMYIELGIGQEHGDVDLNSSSDVTLRHAYGWWDVNPSFQIMAGKSTTPFSPLDPDQLVGKRSGSLNINGVGYGNFYSGEFAQIRGTFKFEKWGRVVLALVDPNGTRRTGEGGEQFSNNFYPYDVLGYGYTLGVDYQNDSNVPRIDIGVPLYFGPVSIYPSFLYQYRSVDVINPVLSRYDDSLTTYIGSLGVKAGYGPFTIAAEGQWGENWGNSRGLIGISAPAFLASAVINPNTGELNDAQSYGYWIDASYKLGPVTPHVMFGQMKSKVDVTSQQGTAEVEMESTSSFWGFSIPIDLAKGFRVRPEVMWYDDGELEWGGNDIQNFEEYAIYGVQFQITF